MPPCQLSCLSFLLPHLWPWLKASCKIWGIKKPVPRRLPPGPCNVRVRVVSRWSSRNVIWFWQENTKILKEVVERHHEILLPNRICVDSIDYARVESTIGCAQESRDGRFGQRINLGFLFPRVRCTEQVRLLPRILGF